jgi:two-component system sensor kinase FixL
VAPAASAAPRPTGPRRLAVWLVTLAAVLVTAVFARAIPSTWLARAAIFLLFVPAVLLGSTLGGLTVGLFATAAAVAAGFLAGPYRSADSAWWASAALFLVIGVGISLRGEWLMRTQANLRHRESRLQSILDTVPDAIVVIDERGIVQSLSTAAERQFGWPAADVVGRNVSMLMPSPHREAHDGFLARYLATGERRIIGIGRVVAGLRRDGSTFPMELAVGEAIVGDHRFFTGFVRDLTESQRHETRLQDLQAELAHAMRVSVMGEMASSLAHELNQPLSAIANYLRGARRLMDRQDPEDRPRLDEAVDRAAEQALRAGDVVRRLREFMGRGESEKRIESLAMLVGEASALALVGAKDQGVRFSVRLDPGCDEVLADRIQIEQVLINLIRNGLEAMADSSRRELTVSSVAADGNMTAIRVSDTGPGFDEDVRASLFRPFVTSKKHGMGVGLSICRTIVEAHGGSIWAESNPGGGASIVFTLPRDVEGTEE